MYATGFFCVSISRRRRAFRRGWRNVLLLWFFLASDVHVEEGITIFYQMKPFMAPVGVGLGCGHDVAHRADDAAAHEVEDSACEHDGDAEDEEDETCLGIEGVAFLFIVGEHFISCSGVGFESRRIVVLVERRQELAREIVRADVVGDAALHLLVCCKIPVVVFRRDEENEGAIFRCNCKFVDESVP